jgi:thioredoxin reductase (NADPH)
MDARNDSPDSRPILLVVDADPDARERLGEALCRRFGADYRVLAADSAAAGLATLDRLANDGAEVALVAADHTLPGTDGIAFLALAQARHPSASRALLVGMDRRGTRIPFSALESLQRATALGRIDFWVVKGWQSPEELLYPQVQEALSQWTRANRPRHEVVRVIGERWSAQCHTVLDTLSRNTVPFGFYEAASLAGQEVMGEYDVDPAQLPAAIFHDGTVLRNPSGTDLAAALGVQTEPTTELFDLAIVGGGPAGLAAAVYGASEGLRTVVIEQQAIGGQAGTSSMIRNYLGFPHGLSGGELTFRAFEQALLFGTQFIFSHSATGLKRQDGQQVITLADGAEVRASAAIIAAGVSYRRLGIPTLDRLIGRGVFYGAAGVEATAVAGEQVCVIGGANSAGQAALHLAKFAAKVTLLVRGDSLEAAMSDYLIRQLQASPNIAVRLRTQVVDGQGTDRLEALVLENGEAGTSEDVPAAAVFVLIGAEPRTEWLDGAVARDERGFVLTGRDLCPEPWSLERQPLPFETSQPGVFAVGDVRHGAVMRVASAVGEGSVAVGSVHRYLAETCRHGS